jgi:branched-chain amino acid transport system permease protein
LLLTAPFWAGALLGAYWVRILDYCLLYAILALGLNIVVGYAGLLDLGFIAFYAVGAYVFALLASPHVDLHWSPWLILPISAAVAALVGALLGAPTLRLRGDYLAIVTLGFGEIVRLFITNLDRPVNITNGPQGISGIDPLSIGGWRFDQGLDLGAINVVGAQLYFYVLLALVIVAVVACRRLENSRIGRAWVAIREDEVAATAMGINTRNMKLLAFAMGASFGGIGGGLFASFQGFVSPESFTLMESVMVLCMVVLGGMGHVPGVLLGAFLLTITPEILREVISPLQQQVFGHQVVDPENLRMLLFGLAMILVMLYRPGGLWPSARRAQELKHD